MKKSGGIYFLESFNLNIKPKSVPRKDNRKKLKQTQYYLMELGIKLVLIKMGFMK